MSTKHVAIGLLSACLATAGASLAAGTPAVSAVSGEASANSVNATMTIGSVQLKLLTRGERTVKLTCGLLGQLQGQNDDGSLQFQHTVACDDHSVFVLLTHTVVTPQSACTTRPGIVGTFREDSIVQGVDGPYTGATGQLTIAGTLNCGFNDMQITGTITRQ
jgi:hypothetical protein